MKVLFVLEEYADAAAEVRVPSPHYYTTLGAFQALCEKDTSLSCVVWPYDLPMQLIASRGLDEAFVEICLQNKPDLVFGTVLLSLGDGNIMPETYRHVRDILKIPVVLYWLESAPDVVRWADIYAPYVTANLFSDTAEHWKKFTKFPEKTFRLVDPKDPRVFYASDYHRNLSLTFVGSVLGRMDRALNIGLIEGGGLRVGRLGGDWSRPISEYADFLRRSQITLNFSSAITFQHVNGRPAEAPLCGACLFESDNQETAAILDPFVHYVPFTETFHIDESTGQLIINNNGDLLAKLNYYMGKGKAEAEKIAIAGHERALEVFSPRRFWQGVFKIANL